MLRADETTQPTSSKKKVMLIVLPLGVIILGLAALNWILGLVRLGFVDSAIVRIRSVIAAEADFAKAHTEVGYTCALSQLPQDQLMTSLVREPRKNGYAFQIDGCEPLMNGEPNQTYHVTARPLHSHLPGFCSDQSGVLWYDDSGSVDLCLARRVPLN
jgi:hypothetical protein